MTSEQAKKFEEQGYLVIEDFLTGAEIESLKDEMRKIVDKMNPEEECTTVFKAGENSAFNQYFMSSVDKIRFFFEDEAVDKEGNILGEKHKALNKIGHALHWLNPEFKKVTFSNKLQKAAREVAGLREPVVVQSMAIFKPPRIGGPVTPHQDLSYLYTDPPKLCGFWMALEDATLENGCMWFIPGSHKDGVKVLFRRTPDKNSLKVEYDGPQDYPEEGWVAAPVKKGALVLIDGAVVHKSEKNLSDKSRLIYTFHVAETHNTKWSELNWLQPADQMPFPSLYR